MSKLKSALTILSVVAAGYAVAEIIHQKKQKEQKKRQEAPHMGNMEDFERYQRVFMEDDVRPDVHSFPRCSYHCYYNHRNRTLIEEAFDSIEEKKYKYKHRNDPKQSSDNNLLFGTFERQPFGLTIDNMKCNRNTNVLTIGYSSNHDKYNYITSNIMQENGSALIVDPNGDLFRSLAPGLMAKGYPVYLFDPTKHSPTVSNHYNPLDYVYDANGDIDEVQIDILTDIYLKIAKEGKKTCGGDPFWENTEKAFLKALIYYVLENDDIPKEEKCFNKILKLVQTAKTEDDDEESPLTMEINALSAKMESEGKLCKAKECYNTFLIAPRITTNAILITTLVDLQIFSADWVNHLTSTDTDYPARNIDFKKICTQQAYLFVVVPVSHQAYDFLYSSLFWQFYATAYMVGERICRGKYHIGYRRGLPAFDYFDSLEEAEAFKEQASIIESDYINDTKAYNIVWTSESGVSYSKKTCFSRDAAEKYVEDLKDMQIWSGDDFGHGDPALPVHVNVFLTDLANCAYIPNLLTILSTSRGYRIGTHCLIGSVEQLKKMYSCGEHETLLANMDTIIYFGSYDQPGADIKLIQRYLGKTTIVNDIPQETFLMTQKAIDEIGGEPESGEKDNREIVMVRDVSPFICQKYRPENHKRYEDYKKVASVFSVEKYFTEA